MTNSSHDKLTIAATDVDRSIMDAQNFVRTIGYILKAHEKTYGPEIDNAFQAIQTAAELALGVLSDAKGRIEDVDALLCSPVDKSNNGENDG